jgi:adenylate cyclase
MKGSERDWGVMLIFSQDGDVLVFIVDSQTGSPKAIRFTATTFLIGSAPNCNLVMPEAAPKHVRIERQGEEVILLDLDTPGGTYVNDKRVKRVRLKTGDRINLVSSPTRTFKVAPIPKVSAEVKGAQGLLRLSVALGRPGPLEEKLDEILEYSLQLGSFDRAAIWVQDPDREGEFLHHRHRQKSGWPAPEVSHTILGEVLKGEALIIGDAALDARVEKAMSVQIQKVRTCVALPLRTTERIWGVLYLDCLDPRPLASDQEREFLEGFAALAAVAVANSWLSARAQSESLMADRLTRFFPPHAVEKIVNSRHGPLGGRELRVTILFCDIRNYTGISFEQPPKRVAAWLNDYFSRIVPLVFANNGTLEKYIGDAMLAIWGAPLEMTPAEQALHSCRAAIAIQKAVTEFSRAWPDLPCQVGIGIHHGLAYVGTIGHESYLQYAAFGSTTNLAARLCSAAGPGETILSRYLADLLPPDQFQTVPRPAVHAKGFPEVVEVRLLQPIS